MNNDQALIYILRAPGAAKTGRTVDEGAMILTAAEYIAARRKRRPATCTLATFDECYPRWSIVNDWASDLNKMFRQAKEDGEVVRLAVLRSMEVELGAQAAYTDLQRLAKNNPAVLPPRWWEHMAAWKAAEYRGQDVELTKRTRTRAGQPARG